jgi:hypothetical protein
MNQQTVRDTTYKITSRVNHIDTAVSVGTLAVVDTPTTSVKVMEVKPPMIKAQTTAFDSIKPCSESLVEEFNYTPFKIHDVRINEQKEMPMSYDIPISGVVLAFTMYITVQYLITSQAAWKSLVDNIRKEMA